MLVFIDKNIVIIIIHGIIVELIILFIAYYIMGMLKIKTKFTLDFIKSHNLKQIWHVIHLMYDIITLVFVKYHIYYFVYINWNCDANGFVNGNWRQVYIANL